MSDHHTPDHSHGPEKKVNPLHIALAFAACYVCFGWFRSVTYGFMVIAIGVLGIYFARPLLKKPTAIPVIILLLILLVSDWARSLACIAAMGLLIWELLKFLSGLATPAIHDHFGHWEMQIRKWLIEKGWLKEKKEE